MMLAEVRRARRTWVLVKARLPEFLRILHLDLASFQTELIRSIAGAVFAAVGGFMLAGFFSVALIVTAWDSKHRVAMAWLVCLLWSGIAAVGLWYARRALQGPLPFSRVSAELKHDFQQTRRE